MKRIAKFSVWGAIGFGVGGAIGGATWVAFDAPHIGFAIFGALGGASFCLNRGDWKRTVITALVALIHAVYPMWLGLRYQNQ